MPDTLTPEQIRRKIEELSGKARKRPPRKPPRKAPPGASDEELYPTDTGAVEFRLAARRGRRRPSRRGYV